MYRFWYNSNFYGNFNYVNANIKFMISHLYIVRLSLFKIMRDSHSQPHNTLPTQLTGSSSTTLYKLLVLYSQCGTRVFTYTKTCNSKAMHFFYKIYMDNCVIYQNTLEKGIPYYALQALFMTLIALKITEDCLWACHISFFSHCFSKVFNRGCPT
jgi:hypothetical protein